MPSTLMKEIFNRPEAAEFLGVSISTIKRLEKLGLLVPVPGTDGKWSQRMFTRAELERFKRSN